MRAVTRIAKVGYAVLLRTLLAVGGAIAAYGATAMFTTAGIMPPNSIVIAGVALCVTAAMALRSSEGGFTGMWPALLIAAVPFSLYAFGSLGQEECAQPHPPITPTYSCAPVGSRAIAVIAPAVSLVGLAILVLDLRMLSRGLSKRGVPPRES
jgi:hypothetical protein